MKHHSVLSQSSATLSGFRNLTQYSCISLTAINTRKFFTGYSKINNHMDLPEKQMTSLQRLSKVNSLMTQEENSDHSMKGSLSPTAAWAFLKKSQLTAAFPQYVLPDHNIFMLKDLTRVAFFTLSI